MDTQDTDINQIYKARLAHMSGQIFALYTDLKQVRAQLKIATDALEYLKWPGMDYDFWDRANKAEEALAKIQEMGK